MLAALRRIIQQTQRQGCQASSSMKSSRLHLVAMHLVLAACQLPLATADATGAHWGSGTGRRYSHPLLSRGRASVSALRGKVGLAGLRQHQWYPPSPSKEDAFADAPLLGAAEGLLQGNWTGRIHVTAFGADPSGRRDSSPAIQRALDAAWALGSQAGLNLSSYGGPDLGGIVVDFDGGHYTLSAPLVLPKAGGGNLWISNGALHADGGFPAGRFLLEFPVIAAVRHTLRFRYLTFENMEFDAAQRAAGGVKYDWPWRRHCREHVTHARRGREPPTQCSSTPIMLRQAAGL